jgi:phage shock protein A
LQNNDKTLASEIATRERNLNDVVRAKDAELKQMETTVTRRYEKMLDDLNTRSSAALDKYNAQAKAYQKALALAEGKAEKVASNSARELDSMKSKVEAMEAKLRQTGLQQRASAISSTGEERSLPVGSTPGAELRR